MKTEWRKVSGGNTKEEDEYQEFVRDFSNLSHERQAKLLSVLQREHQKSQSERKTWPKVPGGKGEGKVEGARPKDVHKGNSHAESKGKGKDKNVENDDKFKLSKGSGKKGVKTVVTTIRMQLSRPVSCYKPEVLQPIRGCEKQLDPNTKRFFWHCEETDLYPYGWSRIRVRNAESWTVRTVMASTTPTQNSRSSSRRNRISSASGKAPSRWYCCLRLAITRVEANQDLREKEQPYSTMPSRVERARRPARVSRRGGEATAIKATATSSFPMANVGTIQTKPTRRRIRAHEILFPADATRHRAPLLAQLSAVGYA